METVASNGMELCSLEQFFTPTEVALYSQDHILLYCFYSSLMLFRCSRCYAQMLITVQQFITTLPPPKKKKTPKKTQTNNNKKPQLTNQTSNKKQTNKQNKTKQNKTTKDTQNKIETKPNKHPASRVSISSTYFFSCIFLFILFSFTIVASTVIEIWSLEPGIAIKSMVMGLFFAAIVVFAIIIIVAVGGDIVNGAVFILLLFSYTDIYWTCVSAKHRNFQSYKKSQWTLVEKVERGKGRCSALSKNDTLLSFGSQMNVHWQGAGYVCPACTGVCLLRPAAFRVINRTPAVCIDSTFNVS